jgi:hypothetical protein
VVGDQPDVAELFRQCFRLEVRQGIYVVRFAKSGDEALEHFWRTRSSRRWSRYSRTSTCPAWTASLYWMKSSGASLTFPS